MATWFIPSRLLSIVFCLFSIGMVNGQSLSRKNVLFIAVDDLRPTLGCYGDRIARTPNIDKLASDGIVFDRAYCQQAVCAPSRSSLLTGLRPDKIRVWGLNKPFRETVPEVITLPQFFKTHGYYSQGIGKIFHDPKKHQDPLSWSGKTIFTVTQSGKGHKYILPENLTGKKGTSTERLDVPDSAYIDGKVCNAALEVLNKLKDSIFFLAVGFRRPHLPFTAPDKYWRLYDKVSFDTPDTTRALHSPPIAFHKSQELRGYKDIPDGPLPTDLVRKLQQGYYASTSYIDAQVGKLLEELERLKLRDNTIVVLWSDHGYHLGDQGLWAKSTNFENAVRVPLIISAPGVKSTGAHAAGLVELVDLYPTLLELCGLPVPNNLDGKSLVPMLNAPRSTVKSFALSQFVRPYESLFSDSAIKVMGYSLRTENYRYTEWRDFATHAVVATELYDHKNDPEEKINIAGKTEPSRLRGFQRILSEALEKNCITGKIPE